jgi:hypothetical protein
MRKVGLSAPLWRHKVEQRWSVFSAITSRRAPEPSQQHTRAEAFNIFNHATSNWGDGADGINKLDRAQFRAGGTFKPRQLQFGLKLFLKRGDGIRPWQNRIGLQGSEFEIPCISLIFSLTLNVTGEKLSKNSGTAVEKLRAAPYFPEFFPVGQRMVRS